MAITGPVRARGCDYKAARGLRLQDRTGAGGCDYKTARGVRLQDRAVVEVTKPHEGCDYKAARGLRLQVRTGVAITLQDRRIEVLDLQPLFILQLAPNCTIWRYVEVIQ